MKRRTRLASGGPGELAARRVPGRARLALVALAGLGLLSAAALFAAGEALSRPARSHVGAAPSGLNVTELRIATPDGGHLAGWAAPGRPGAGAVLLLHGVRADRRQMAARARFLQSMGHGVLLVDLPAHGESSGDRITFGAREAVAVERAIAQLASDHPGEKLAVIGVSLGAASLVLGAPARDPARTLDAVVLESMYPTIDDAVADRLALHLGAPAAHLVPLLLAQLPLRLGVTRGELRPIDAIARLRSPLLIVSGAEDRHTTQAETERLFAAARDPKALWIVPAAAHVDLHAFAPRDYEERIGAFLSRHLRSPGPRP